MDTNMVLREIETLAADLMDLCRIIHKSEEFAEEFEQRAKKKAEEEGRQPALVPRVGIVGGSTHWQFITKKFRNLVQAVGAEWPPEEPPRGFVAPRI